MQHAYNHHSMLQVQMISPKHYPANYFLRTWRTLMKLIASGCKRIYIFYL